MHVCQATKGGGGAFCKAIYSNIRWLRSVFLYSEIQKLFAQKFLCTKPTSTVRSALGIANNCLSNLLVLEACFFLSESQMSLILTEFLPDVIPHLHKNRIQFLQLQVGLPRQWLKNILHLNLSQIKRTLFSGYTSFQKQRENTEHFQCRVVELLQIHFDSTVNQTQLAPSICDVESLSTI